LAFAVKIYVTGISGTGKSSVARALLARGVQALDLDYVSHWENRHTGTKVGWAPGKDDDWYNSHGWICDIKKLGDFLAKNSNAVALGHSSNHDEYIPLFDKVLILRCRPEIVIARINARTVNDYGKHPAEQTRLLIWQKTFEVEMAGKGAIALDAERPLSEVVRDVVRELS